METGEYMDNIEPNQTDKYNPNYHDDNPYHTPSFTNDIPYQSIATEVTVRIKDSERTYRQKFLIYDKYYLEPTDPIMQQCIQEALKSFGQCQEDISINIKASLKVQ